MKAVFNTSPLIFLSKLGYLGKTLSLFDGIFIPGSVLEEISTKDDKVKTNVKEFVDSNYLKVKNTHLEKLFESLYKKLGKGESEAIALAVEMNLDYAILDDSAARKQALSLGLKVKGTLGIIRKLVEDNKIVVEDINELHKKLFEMGFRVDKNIFIEIFRDIR